MKQRTSKILALLLTAALLCGVLPCGVALPAVAAEENLLQNGGFETKNGDGWTIPSPNEVTVSKGGARVGNYSASISGKKEIWNSIYQMIPVRRNSTYHVSFYYSGFLALYVKGAATYEATDLAEIGDAWPTSNALGTWKRYDYYVNSGPYDYLFVQFSCGGSTTGFTLDGASVVLMEDGVVNGDFETGNLDGWVNNADKCRVITTAAKSGRYGVEVTSGIGSWDEYQGLLATVPTAPNTDYVLSFDHKSDTDAGAIVYVKNADKSADIVADWPTQVKGYWTHYEVHFNSGDNYQVNLQLCVGAKNSVRCFDNVRVTRVVKRTPGGGQGSVSQSEDGLLGVAFRFDMPATVQVAEPGLLVGGTIDPYAEGVDYELVRMGAVVTNKPVATADLTLEAVDGEYCIDVPATHLFDAKDGQVSFAVRVINIPTAARDVTLHARAYYVYMVGGKEKVMYAGGVCSESYNSIVERSESAVFDPGDEWELYWSDEFGGTKLDETKWEGSVGSGGSGDVTYLKTNRSENIKVEDGNLVLTARKESIGNRSYTTGYVSTGNKFSFLYGRLEFRVKMPYGKGVWPAMWTLGDYYLYTDDTNGWPYGGEIDILEMVGESNEDPYEEHNRTASHNIHWGPNRDTHFEVGSYKLGDYNNHYVLPESEAPSEVYHVYAIEWAYRNIKFYVDDVLCKEVRWGTEEVKNGWFGGTKIVDYLAWYDGDGNQVGKVNKLDSYDDNGNKTSRSDFVESLDFAFCNEDNPHWLIMNIGLCEGWGDMSNKTDGGNFPQSMYVDYVRVYKPVEN